MKGEKKKKNKFLYKNINLEQWDIMEYLHYNMGIKKPMQLNARKIGNHLDVPEKKVKSHLSKLKNEKLITLKKLFITRKGMRTKKSYERKYDPSP